MCVCGCFARCGALLANADGKDTQTVTCRHRSTFARSSADFVAGAALSQCWNALFANANGMDTQSADIGAGEHFRKVKCRFCDRRSTFARSSTDFVAGAALSKGQVRTSWQAQRFQKIDKYIGSSMATHLMCGARRVAPRD